MALDQVSGLETDASVGIAVGPVPIARFAAAAASSADTGQQQSVDHPAPGAGAKFLIGDPVEALLLENWAITRDNRHMAALINRFQPLIAQEARRAVRVLGVAAGATYEDARQTATLAFMRAVEDYEPERGYRSMAPLAKTYVRRAVSRMIADNERPFRQCRSGQEMRIRRTMAQLVDDGLEAGEAMVARIGEATGDPASVIRDTVWAASARMVDVASAELPTTAVDSDAVIDAASFARAAGLVRGFAARLDTRERRILDTLIEGAERATDVAASLGISNSRVSQIRARLRQQLIEHLAAAGVTADILR